jgi:hypothetical protein
VDDSLVSLLLLNSSAKGVVLDTDTGTVIPADPSLSLRPGGLAVHTDQSVNRDPTALIDIRSGRVLTTDKEVLACVKYDIYARSLSAGAVCSNPRTTGYEGVTKTGTVDLETVRFSEPGARPLTVQFDGPHTGGGGDELLTVDAIPGAVIVYSTLHPADGHRSRLFGLR